MNTSFTQRVLSLQKTPPFVMFLAPILCVLCFRSPDQVIALFPDDAFYYLKIAQTWAQLGIISFDRESITNGFHPLNQFFFGISSLLIPAKKMVLFAYFSNALLIYFPLWVLVHHCFRGRSFSIKVIAYSVFCMPIFTLLLWVNTGMESMLILPITVCLFVLLDREVRHGFVRKNKVYLIAFVVGLLILARLDLVIALFPLGCYLVWVLPTLNQRFWVAGVLVAMLGGYLLWNYIQVGHLFPVSAAVKRFQGVEFSASWHASTGGNLVENVICLSPLLVSVLYLLLWIILKRTNPSDNESFCGNSIVAVLNAGVVLFYCYLFFLAVNFFRWYFVFPVVVQLISLVSLSAAIELPTSIGIKRLGRPVMVLVVCSGFLANLGFLNWALERNTVSQKLHAITLEMNQLIGPGKKIGVFDAGVVGYFSNGVVYNLDGLVNSYDFFERHIKLGRYGDYIDAKGIRYLLVRSNMIEGREGAAWLAMDPRVAFNPTGIVKKWRIGPGFEMVLIRLKG